MSPTPSEPRGSSEPGEPAMSQGFVKELIGTWDYSTLPPNVRLGTDCFIESKQAFAKFSSTRDPGLVLGDRVRVYAAGWGSGFGILDAGLVTIGDDSVLIGGQFMCGEQITVGKRVVISYNAIISDGDFHPLDPELRRRDALYGAPFDSSVTEPGSWTPKPVIIEDDVRIGINAIVLKGVRIGAGALVRPGAVVTSDVPAGAVVEGNPARARP